MKRRRFLAFVSSLLVFALAGGIFLRLTAKADSYFGMNEGYGDTVHDNTGAVSGTRTNAVWKPESECLSGTCLFFDGTGDYVSFGNTFDFTDSSNFTISVWIRHTPQTTGTDVILAKTNVSAGYKLYMESDGDITFGIDDDASWGPDASVSSTAATYDDNRWHHIAAVKTGTTKIELYIDGLLVGYNTAISGVGSITNSANFYLGIDGDGSGNPYTGYIDELKIYTATAKTADTIKGDVLAGSASSGSAASFSPDTSNLTEGLVGYWKLDESSGNVTDSSGNGYTLTNNNTTTFVGGKFGNGSEHVPASSQFFDVTSTIVDTYYFASVPTDPDSAWEDDASAFDGSTLTYASSLTSGDTNTNYLLSGSTSSPGSGSNTISQVRARIYGFTPEVGQLRAAIYIDGPGELLGNPSKNGGEGWGAFTTLSTPAGGWTWGKVNLLDTKVYCQDQSTCLAYRIEVEVTSTSGSGQGPADVKSVSFWTNPDTDTNYYINLSASANIQSSSGTLATAGFANPKVYVNGVQTNTIAANVWQLVTVTSDTAINADAFYIGRIGSSYYDGTMDEVRLYNRTLSPADVSQLYSWAPGPVAYYKFDEDSGQSAYDSSGNGYHLTLGADSSPDTDDPTWSNGKFGQALKFDGSNDGVYNDSAPISAYPFTLQTWIKSSDAAGNDQIFAISDKDDGYPFYSISIDSDNDARIYSDNETTAVATDGTSTIIDGNWHFVAVVYSSNTSRSMYVDGVLDHTDTTSHTYNNANDRISIGRPGYEFAGGFYSGQIDDVKIYNYARTPGQIVEDMNAGHPAPGSPVGSATAYWKFDEGYNTTANDSSINNLDLTLSSASWTNSGKFGKAFNGATNIRASIADNSALKPAASEDFTISTWFKSDGVTTAATEYLISKMTGSAGYQMYFNTTGNLVCGIDDDDTGFPEDSVTTATDYYDTTWHHAVCVRDITGDKLLLYIDGQLKASDPDLSATGSMAGDTITFYIGDQNGTDDTDEFLGDVDETQFFRELITPDQVKLLYNQGQAAVMGAVSTTSTGTASWSAADSYCPPGQDSACTAPVAEWKMDENLDNSCDGTSDACDTSGNGNHGTKTNMESLDWVPGKFGSSLSFDGENDYVNVGDNAALNVSGSFTIEAWIYPRVIPGASAYADIVVKIEEYWLEIGNSDELHFGFQTGASLYDHTVTSSPLVLNQWQHIVGVFDDTNNTVKLFHNGIQVLSDAETHTPDSSLNDLTIGAYNVSTQLFNGNIDNVRIYKYARTPAQIAWDYNQGEPAAWWKFDECTGTAVNDTMGNVAAGTITPGSNGNTAAGTCSGIATDMWKDGAIGKRNASLGFDGDDDYVTTPNARAIDFDVDGDDSRTSMSYAFWIYAASDGENNSGYIFDKGGTWFCNVENQTVSNLDLHCEWDLTTTSATKVISNAFTINTWNHIVVTWNNDGDDEISIYINGQLKGISTNGSGDCELGDTSPLITGANYLFNNSFEGLIDDFRIYAYELSPQQIRNVYNESAIRFGPATGSPQ